jgi:DNA invertase Pin-like site-specific DNA recombinase
MTVYGYARTSTVEQIAGLEDQVAKLKKAGCTDQTIYREHASAVKMDQRKAFAEVMEKMKAGDVLVVATLSRIARSITHLMEIQAKLEANGASLNILDLKVDTSTPQGRLQLTLLGAIAQFERELMLERQKVGIEAAKAEGKYKGRAPTARAKADKVLAYAAKGLTKQEIADALSIGVASVYRILAEANKSAA